MERSAAEMFVITITPSRGYAFVYVNSAGIEPDPDNPMTYQYSATAPFLQAQSVLVPPTSCPATAPGQGNRCVYSILVHAQVDTSYTIVLETANSSTTLTAGVTVTGYVPNNQYTYYSFYVPSPRMRVEVQMTALAGDPDLYVSRTNPRPSVTSYDWDSASSLADDIVAFDWTDFHFSGGISMEGTYYVSVWAYPIGLAAQFRLTLLLTPENGVGTLVTLIPGQAVTRSLTTGQYDDYYFIPPAQGWPYAIGITVTPISGDPDLHVARTFRPRVGNSTWTSSTPAGSVDQLYITPQDPRACSPLIAAQQCQYYISVESWSNTQYSILLALINGNGSTSSTQLTNGVTLQGTVFRNAYSHYYFVPQYGAGQTRGTVVFIVTSISGNPDLYASASYPQPTMEHHEYAASAAASDILVLNNVNSSVVFLGVHGASFQPYAQYTVLATMYNPATATQNALTLINGLPQTDFVLQGDYKYYTYTLTDANTERLVFGVQPRSGGDPDLFVLYPQVDGTAADIWPSTAQYDAFSNDVAGFDVVGIQNPHMGVYRIAVLGFRQTIYSITAVRSNTTLVLNTGLTYPGQVFQGQYAYYVFYVTQQDLPLATKQLTFSLNVKPGQTTDPDIFCSDVYPMPINAPGRYNWSSFTVGSDLIIISGRTGDLHVGAYYCGVYGFSAATYSLSAYLNARDVLMDGVMQQSSLAAGEVKHYSFSMTPGMNASDLTITSMAYSGVSYLYVSKLPDPEPEPDGFYRWRSIINNWVVQTISIPKEDCLVAPVGQTQCTYNIAVYSPNNPATFTIVASTSRSWTELQPGIPVQANVGLNEYRYYTFQVPTIRTNWSLTVTADGNRDTDLFVSRTERQPSPTTNEWNAGAFGGTEYMRVDWNSPVYAGTTTVGTYYVGLLGFEPADYTIVLQLMNDMNSTTIVLFDGQPQLGVVRAGQYNHYTYTPSPVNWPYELFISVHPIQGDPDMYVRSDGGLATRESFQWQTTASTGLLDQIRITNTSMGVCNPTNTSRPCHYTIGVLGWEGYEVSMYSITVSTSKSNERLGDGQVVGPRTLAANAYDYFFFVNPTPNHTVTFSLIPSAGAPVMYVATAGSFPNATTNQFPSVGNFVIIPRAVGGVYYLSVHSVQPSSYSLMATSYNPDRPEENVRLLFAGTTFADVLAAGHYRYYYFDLSSVEPTDYLYVALATDAGTPRVYANFHDDRPGVFPSNATNGAQWVQTQTGNAVFALTIQAPRDGRYVLAVQAANGAPTSYRITVSLAGTTQAMYVGSTYPGRLSAGQYNYYRFTVLLLVNNADLSFTVTPQTGNPDIYVSDRIARPSAANATSYTWSSSGTGVDSVVLSNSRLPGSVHTGTYYIAVYAVTDVTYTIVASYGSTIALSDGAQQYQFLNPGQQQRYSLVVPVTAGDVTIQTQQVVGTVSVYVGVNSVPNQAQGNTYQYSQNNVANAFITPARLRCSTVGTNRSTCEYSILVIAPNNAVAVYYIQANTAGNNLLLSNGVAVSGTVTGATPNYYKFNVASMYANVTIQLTTLSGDADLYCSWQYIRPSATQSEWSSATTAEVDRIYFDFTDRVFTTPGTAAIMAGVFYCAVVTAGGFYSSQYRLVYTAVDSSGQDMTVIRLSDGVPQQGSAISQRFTYFDFSPSPQGYPYDIYFQLTAESGDPDLYVRNDGDLPSVNYWQWLSTADSMQNAVELLVIPARDPEACSTDSVILGRCTYRLAVYAWTPAGGADARYDSRFVITASTSNPNTYTTLLEGSSVQGVVGAGLWHYYTFPVANQTMPYPLLTAAVTAISGNPDVYYAYNNQRPDLNSNGSRELGSDIVQFTANPGRWNFGVYGAATTPSNYYIVVTRGAIRLYSGQPQDDVLMRGGSRMYDYTFSSPVNAPLPLVIDLTSNGYMAGVTVYVSVDRGTVSASNYTWMSEGDGTTANTITIPTTHPMYRPNGRYSILVHSATATRVQYTIVVGDTAMATTLVDGQPRTVEAAVPAGQWRYYRGVAASNAAQDLQFGVTAMSGAVTMYVSRSNKAPSATNYTYMATTSSGFAMGSKAVSVVIPRAQIVPGYYYIAVHVEGTVASMFTVTMTTTSLVLAVGGAGGGGGGGGGGGQVATAQQATCATGARYFRMNLPTTMLPAQLNDLTFLVAPADWDSAMYTGRFYLYVSRADQYPTMATAMWSSGALTLNQEWVIARDNWELVACVAEGNRLGTGCNLYVAVSCMPPSGTTSFLLTVNNGMALEPLVDGVPRHATLPIVSTQQNANSRKSYVSYVNEAHGLWLMAETCRGHTQLFVSRTTPAPNTNNAQYRSTKTMAGAVQQVVISEAISNTQFYSSVWATTSNTQYRMWSVQLKDVSSPKELLPVLADPQLSLSKDDELVNVRFRRATLPARYKGVVNNVRYSLRYSLHYADAFNAWSMQSECGLNMTTTAQRLNDAELDVDAETATLSIPLDAMTDELYKLNVLVTIFSQRLGVVGYTEVAWNVYDQELDVRPRRPALHGQRPVQAAVQRQVVQRRHGGAVRGHPARVLHRAHRRPLPVQEEAGAAVAHRAGAARLGDHRRRLSQEQGGRRPRRRLHQRQQRPHQRHQRDQRDQRPHRQGRRRGDGRAVLRHQPHRGQQLLHAVSERPSTAASLRRALYRGVSEGRGEGGELGGCAQRCFVDRSLVSLRVAVVAVSLCGLPLLVRWRRS